MEVGFFDSNNTQRRRSSVTKEFAQILPPKNERRDSATVLTAPPLTLSRSASNISSQMPIVEENENEYNYERRRRSSAVHSDGGRRKSIVSDSRKGSIALMADQGFAPPNSDNCVVITQNLGTSTCYFFQKDPTKNDLCLRPSAAERGLYNFDDTIKALPTSKIIEQNKKEVQSRADRLTFRPTLNERGLPSIKMSVYRPTNIDKVEVEGADRKKLLHSELQVICNKRRLELEEEEKQRSLLNLIPPRRPTSIPPSHRAHNYTGLPPVITVNNKVMEELRSELADADIDKIVKEKKTTTVTETREIVYFNRRLPASIAITASHDPNRLSPTGIPVTKKTLQITHPSRTSTPAVIDRPYVSARNNEKTRPLDIAGTSKKL